MKYIYVVPGLNGFYTFHSTILNLGKLGHVESPLKSQCPAVREPKKLKEVVNIKPGSGCDKTLLINFLGF